MQGEAAFRLALDMEGDVGGFAFQSGLQRRELGAQAGSDCGLDFLLEFQAGWCFERRDGRIAGMSDESTLRLGLDPVREMRDQVFKFHRRILARIGRGFPLPWVVTGGTEATGDLGGRLTTKDT